MASPQSDLQCTLLELNTIQTKLKTLEDAQKDTVNDLQATKLELASLQTKLNYSEDELKSVKSELKASVIELAVLKSHMNPASQQPDLAAVRSELTATKDELSSAQSELMSTREELLSVRDELQTVKSIQQTSTSSLEANQAELAALKTEGAEMKTDLTKLKAQQTSTSDYLTNMKNDVAMVTEGLKRTSSTVTDVWTELQATVKKIVGQTTVASEIQIMSSEQQDLKMEVQKIMNVHKDVVSTSESEFAKVKTALQTLSADMDAMTTELQSMRHVVSETADRDAKSELKPDHVSILETDLAELKNQLKTTSRSIDTIKADLQTVRVSFKVDLTNVERAAKTEIDKVNTNLMADMDNALANIKPVQSPGQRQRYRQKQTKVAFLAIAAEGDYERDQRVTYTRMSVNLGVGLGGGQGRGLGCGLGRGEGGGLRGGLDTSTGVFTAPVSGTYLVWMALTTREKTSDFCLCKGDDTIAAQHPDGSNYGSLTTVLELRKGDTLCVKCYMDCYILGGECSLFGAILIYP